LFLGLEEEGNTNIGLAICCGLIFCVIHKIIHHDKKIVGDVTVPVLFDFVVFVLLRS